MEAAVPFIAVITVVAVFAIIGRFASALAKRLEHRPPDAAHPDPAIGELRQELEAMQERLDFMERILVAQKEQSERALPGEKDQPAPKVRTPT